MCTKWDRWNRVVDRIIDLTLELLTAVSYNFDYETLFTSDLSFSIYFWIHFVYNVQTTFTALPLFRPLDFFVTNEKVTRKLTVSTRS